MKVVCTRMLFWANSMAVMPRLVLVHPSCEHDAVLLAHEAVHCRQMREQGTLRFIWRYLTSRRHRLQMEVEAYQVQLAHDPRRLPAVAAALARGYWLGITVEEAKAALLRGR